MSTGPPPSPMHPVAPPTKKQRSSRESDALSTAADDAIERRRAELRRLQQKRSSQQGALIQQARIQLGGPPQMPASQQAVPRHSDIFPSAPKGVAPLVSDRPESTIPRPRPTARRLDPAFSEKRERARSAPPSRPPPPPIPPPLVAEAPPERPNTVPASRHPPMTPVSKQRPPAEAAPSTVRRDMFESLVASADTPIVSNKHVESEDIRLVKELKQTQDEKAHALRKVARLQEQIHQLQKHEPATLETVVRVAEQSGEMAAITWARQQVSNDCQPPVSQVGFLSPLNASITPLRGSRSVATPLGATHKRVATPRPKCKRSNEDREFLTKAANTIALEYYSSDATYVVRHPFNEEDVEFWDSAGTQSAEAYQMTVDPNKPSTLEVCAKITADGSILTLSGTSTVRHKNATTQEWRVFEDVDEMDGPLGCVLYIDGDANEKEYWLDAIYEEAFATREVYCSSLISAASALQASNTQQPANNSFTPKIVEIVKEVERARSPVKDACVGTEDLNVSVEKEKGQDPTKPTPKAPSNPKKELVEEESSSDALTVFVAMLFSSLFGLVWLVLVRIPIRIFTFGLLLVTTSALLSVIWLYLADDHGAQAMGARIPYGFNQPGIV